MNIEEPGNLNWERIYKELQKPQLKFFYQPQTDKEYLTWIKCHDEKLRSLSFLWLVDLVALEPEIRRAVAEAKSLKGISFTNHSGASHQPFRYHADNACYRIFATMDKVGQLLNRHLGLEVTKPDFKKVIKIISDDTEFKDIQVQEYLLNIRGSAWYKSLSEYRHSLSHRLSPVCENQESYRKLLKNTAQFLEDKPIGYSIDQLENLISHGHEHIVSIIEKCEETLNKVPCRHKHDNLPE